MTASGGAFGGVGWIASHGPSLRLQIALTGRKAAPGGSREGGKAAGRPSGRRGCVRQGFSPPCLNGESSVGEDVHGSTHGFVGRRLHSGQAVVLAEAAGF